MGDQTQHALLSPSRAHRWARCPGSLAMEGQDTTSSIYAEEGEVAHALAHLAYRTGKSPHSFIGRKLDMASKVHIDASMAEHVAHYLDELEEYKGDDGILDIELRVDISDVIGIPDQFGTGDAVIIKPNLQELQAHDFKYGRGVAVQVEDNEQLLLYAAGYWIIYSLVYDIANVRMVIHQPRNGGTSEWAIAVDEMQKRLSFLKEAAKRAHNLYKRYAQSPFGIPDQYLNPGDEQCQFCSARAVCPALRKTAAKVAADYFDDLELKEIVDDPDDLAQAKRLADLLKGWITAVEAKVEERLLAGKPVPGYKVVRGRAGRRFWRDPHSVEFILAEKGEEAFEPRKLRSPAQIEKLLGKKNELWKAAAEHVGQPDGKLSVAKANDKRPAVDVTPADEFFTDLGEE